MLGRLPSIVRYYRRFTGACSADTGGRYLCSRRFLNHRLADIWGDSLLHIVVGEKGISVTPALHKAGRDETLQIRREVDFTKGRIIVRGKLVVRGQAKRADYVLHYRPNIPLAVIEAKDASQNVGDGMQQALDYAAALDVPFVFSSNGDGFLFHDRTGTGEALETTLALDAFPSPAERRARYRSWKGLSPEAEQVVLQPYHDDGGGKGPRYYQVNAINAATEAIDKGRDRILLVM